MESQTVERVTEWDAEPFSDGHAGLRELAAREFTGAVTDGGAWLFMLNGRVLGVFDGDIDRFADADGTAYAAPDRSLPLLFAMRETGGEVRGEYYTEETPISEVDSTLRSGNFTGYVELSENVLSGDYYLVYYGGRRLPVAFIGTQGRRIEGDEAFERADDEVGIYRVRTVDLSITDVPEPEPAENESDTAGAAAGAGTDEGTAGDDATEGEPAVEEDAAVEAEPSEAEPNEAEPTTGDPESSTADDAADPTTDGVSIPSDPGRERDDPAASDTDPDPVERSASATDADERDTGADDRTAGTADTDASASSDPTQDARTEGTTAGAGNGGDEAATADPSAAEIAETTDAPREGDADTSAEAEAVTGAAAAGTASAADRADGESRFTAESEWRGTATIPALDPDESMPVDGGDEPEPGREREREPAPEPDERRVADEEVEALREERDRLRERVEQLEATTDELESETERLTGERDRLERERDEAAATVEELEAELDELRGTVEELEAELEAAEAELAAAQEYVPDGDHEVPPEEAIAGTSLFVRYERKGGPTLEDAHNGDADREAVNDNLRLEHHTEFEDEGAVVDGVAFEEWLRGTIEYGFVEWLTRAFVHDVRETRNQTSLGRLYDAIPDIDRVEFRGTVDLDEAADEDGAAFDVVLRDRMGQPLIVTDLNDDREPATEPMMESLIRNATPVGEGNERLSAAFFVTSSYFEPGALETAEEATGGGFLGRGKNKSFVKLSRKEGYHLCLVETRDGDFHVSVPEL